MEPVELELVERMISRETTGWPMQGNLPLTCVLFEARCGHRVQALYIFNLPTPCSLLMRSYSAEGEQLQCVANSSNAILQPLGASSQCNAFLPSLIMQWHGGLRCSGNVSSYNKKKCKKKTRMLGLWVRSGKLHG